ncbi:ABC transporter permease [Timonella senegalensis]|uniref:ABC transporter permease n=1 Tax=Timonella senegalensis TaxID=1465825 RepID=UPI0028A7864F|nr:ABC transporter permease [Timonella senegalensis]
MMNATYIRIDLARQFRDLGNIIFVMTMPVIMYLIFGATVAGGNDPAGHANVKFYVMASMAAYGAALAATTMTGTAAVEQMQGWGRQMGLTPVSNRSVVAMKVFVALVVTACAIVLIYLVGYVTGARAEHWGIWAATAAITLGGSALYAIFGYMVALRFKSESALGVATGILVLMSFVGNVFMPLTGAMLTFGKFTPMYGYVGLVRWPQLEGVLVQEGGGSDPLWALLLNYGVWLVILTVLAVTSVRRGRSRQ